MGARSSPRSELSEEIARLKRRIEELEGDLALAKRAQTHSSYSDLIRRIEDLEEVLDRKDLEIKGLNELVEDLRTDAASDELKTRLIIVKSKLRQKDITIKDLREKLEKKRKKIESLRKILESGDSTRELKEKNDRLVALESKLGEALGRIADLEGALAVANARASSATLEPPPLASEDVEALKRELVAKDARIEELEAALAGAAEGERASPLGTKRLEMRIRELEAQVQMLRKSEADLRRRYETAVQKLEEAREEW
ncbi:MAG: hypothetical protein Kow0069_37940 [Promethearchaeota archaeon]